ncbi:hypothetical protein H6P81_004440 [Aristolochia fimbriata]|uniref:SNF2 N-terminal domain-containing protein n=1 Tax=Aristolochia fimbriata TaxID=158543 RepID=A0AAV7FI14_ARIFI|nr:hypothetical protein H6P81_004440 [Aristolochia fimbriata]
MSKEKALQAAARAKERIAKQKVTGETVPSGPLKPLPSETKCGPLMNTEDRTSQIEVNPLVAKGWFTASSGRFSSPRKRISGSPTTVTHSPKKKYQSNFDLKLTEVSQELEKLREPKLRYTSVTVLAFPFVSMVQKLDPLVKSALTASSAVPDLQEFYVWLEALFPDVYRNVHDYGRRYCKGGVFGLYHGASNHEELHNLIKATVMIRRLKKDVLKELPEKRRQQVFLSLDEKDMVQLRALFRELEVVKSKIKACQLQEEIEGHKFMQKNLINKIYNDSAEAKIPAVLDYLGMVIEAGCKFLIVAHHQPMLNAIHQFLQVKKKKVGCIRIDGSTQQSSRLALVTEFQEKEEIKAAVLSIKQQVTLLKQKASSVNVYYLLANDTVDDILWDVVQNKTGNLGQMLDGYENKYFGGLFCPNGKGGNPGLFCSNVKQFAKAGNLGLFPEKVPYFHR